MFSSRRRHTRWPRDWSSDVCSSDLIGVPLGDQRFVIIYCHVLPILDPGLLAGLPRYLVSGKRNLRIICLLPCADDFPYDVVGNTLISQYRKGIVSLRVRLTTQGAAIRSEEHTSELQSRGH